MITLSKDYNSKKILVIGDLMIDHYIWGICERISPEAPVPVIDVTREEQTLGGAGNVIKNLCSFGLRPDILSVTGRDEAGSDLRGLLQAEGVNTDSVLYEDTRLTSKKTRVIAQNHHMVRIDKETKTPVSDTIETRLIAFVEQEIAAYDLVLISDYLKGVCSDALLAAVIRTCKPKGIPVLVDPKGVDFSKYRGVNFIKPNRKEAGIAAGMPVGDRSSLLAAGNRLREQVDCEAVIITLSEEGIAVIHDELSVLPTRAREVFDVTGAGDTVLASIGVCIANNLSVLDACIFANHAAAIVVSRVGSSTCTVAEVMEHMEANR